ncbi:MAG: hypothetical protein H6747_15140 [Deltaproteobacteria bacterium]|nr:hypothetical protein [Deltaproteobacteria bacterium]
MIGGLWRRLRRWLQRPVPHGVKLPPWPTLSLGPGLGPEAAGAIVDAGLASGPADVTAAQLAVRDADAAAGRLARHAMGAAEATATRSGAGAAVWLGAMAGPTRMPRAPEISIAGPTCEDRRRANEEAKG